MLGPARRLLVRLATYDAFPGFSAAVRRFAGSPLGCLLMAAAASGLCGAFVHPRALALTGGLAAVVVAGLTWPWVSAAGLSGALSFSRPRATEGEAVEAELRLSNRLPWPVWGLELGGGEPGPVRLPAAAGRSRVVLEWAFAPGLRGVYPGGPVRVRTAFPFGLCEAGRAVTARPLVVWPRTFPVGPALAPAGADPTEAGEQARPGGIGELMGVRPYRRGDRVRRIHWPQSARHGRLIVREEQDRTRRVAMIALDLDPRVHTPGPDGSLEWAIRTAASCARGWLGQGAEVGLIWAGGSVPARGGPRQAEAILDALAALPARPSVPPLPELLASPACRGGRQTVITTDRAVRPPRPGRVYAVLASVGFGGPAGSVGAGEVRFESPADVQRRLRQSWEGVGSGA